jgi:glycosyltransferase involved in cell wall biosynthesis
MRTLFVIQLCEAKSILDSAGYHEIYKPMLASGRIRQHRLLSYGEGLDFYSDLVRKRIAELQVTLGRQPVIVYGAGAHTEKYFPLLNQLNIVALADREPSLWGWELCGLPIIPPQEMGEKRLPVVVSSRAWETSILGDLGARYPQLPSLHGLYDLERQKERSRDRQLKEIGQAIRDLKPDLLVYAPNHPADGFTESEVDRLRMHGHFKLITVWWDYDEESESNSYLDFERRSLRYSDLVLDAGNLTKTQRLKQRVPPYQHHERVEKVLFGPSLVNPEYFYAEPGVSKTYDIAVFGGAFGRRRDWIDGLSTRFGSRFHHIGGAYQQSEILPMAEYARRLRSTRITVNTQTYPLRTQLKGKVIEALACGVMLMEEDNPDTRQFIPDEMGVVYFKEPGQLYDALDYYLGHERERIELAKSASEWYWRNYSFRSWFDRILEHLPP